MVDLAFSKLSIAEKVDEIDDKPKETFLNHPFLIHEQTIDFIKKSKVQIFPNF